MKKNKKELGSFIIPFLIILWIPKEVVERVFRFIEFRGLNIDTFETLIRMAPRETAMTVILLAAVLVLVFNIFRKISSVLHPQVPGLNQPRPKTPAEAVRQDRSARTSDRTADAAAYVSKSGRERYLSQLDSYLQSGLVTKEEYQVLKRRYDKLQ